MATTCADITTGYCNPGQIREFFEAARDTVKAEVTRENYDTPNFWRDFMPKGDWELGKGWQQREKTYEQSYIEAHSDWQKVSAEVEAGRGCALTPELIDYGHSFHNFEMEQISVRGPSVCFKDIPDMQSFSEELERQYGELARVGTFKFENRYRDAHILFSDRMYLGAPDGAGGMPYYENAFPSVPGGGVALAHQSMLDHIAADFDAAGGWNDNMGMFDAAPHYFMVASPDVSDQIIRSDAGKEDRQDIRESSMADELLKRWHVSLRWKRFFHVMDTQAARFDWDATNTRFVRVPYFKKEKATNGYKAVPNPSYRTAKYEAIICIANRLGPQALMMPQISEPGGQTNFDVIHNNFDFEFVNHGDNEKNPRRNHGFFLGDAMEAINPRKRRFVKVLLVARDTNSIQFVTPTAPSGSVPAVAGLKNSFLVDRCGFLPETTCCNFADFTCAVATSTTAKANAINLSPIRDGAVAVTDTVKIAGAGDTIFTVEAINSTGGLTNNEVRLGYDGAAIDCADLVKDWKLYDSTTGVDVEA